MAFISVVVPVYKTNKLKLRRCIRSILDQTHQELEVILVDDGNPEDYVTLLQQYAKMDSRVRIISKANGGVASARNAGIEEAHGDYLSFIDSDDFVELHFLSRLLGAIKDSDLSICGVWEQHFPCWDGWFDIRFFKSKPTMFNGLQYINFSVNKLYKVSVIKENNIQFPVSVKLGEDALFLSQYYQHCRAVRCIPDCLYHYVPDAGSAVNSYKPMYWDWETQVINEQHEMFHSYPLTLTEEEAMYAWLFRKFNGALNYYIDNEKDLAKRAAIVERIISHNLYTTLMVSNLKNPHLTPKEIKRLKLWKWLGSRGILIAYKISMILRRLRR